jgi:uncharacterized RDD family membrane protein YckC
VRTTPAAAVQAPAPIVPRVGLRIGGGRAYAGFWIRFAALFVDTLVIGIPAYLLERTFGTYGSLAFLSAWLYHPLMESSASQGTIGKIVFGLIVTDTSFQRISFGRALGRYAAKILSTLTLNLGYVMAGLTSQKRALNDYIAGTLVLRA